MTNIRQALPTLCHQSKLFFRLLSDIVSVHRSVDECKNSHPASKRRFCIRTTVRAPAHASVFVCVACSALCTNRTESAVLLYIPETHKYVCIVYDSIPLDPSHHSRFFAHVCTQNIHNMRTRIASLRRLPGCLENAAASAAAGRALIVSRASVTFGAQSSDWFVLVVVAVWYSYRNICANSVVVGWGACLHSLRSLRLLRLLHACRNVGQVFHFWWWSFVFAKETTCGWQHEQMQNIHMQIDDNRCYYSSKINAKPNRAMRYFVCVSMLGAWKRSHQRMNQNT